MKSIFTLLALSLLINVSKPRRANLNNQHRVSDSIMLADTDASSIPLQYRFAYVKGNEQESNLLETKQKSFLKQMNLPTSGFTNLEESRILILEKQYANMLKKLANHPYQSLYRQVSSQILVKYYCSTKTADEANLYPPHDKIKFYLYEFRACKGVNIGLIYSGFLKLKLHNSDINMCSFLKDYIPYCNNLIAEEQSDLGGTKEPASIVQNESQKSIMQLMNYTLDRDRNYLLKIKMLERSIKCK